MPLYFSENGGSCVHKQKCEPAVAGGGSWEGVIVEEGVETFLIAFSIKAESV
jgi:hypothetical protein